MTVAIAIVCFAIGVIVGAIYQFSVEGIALITSAAAGIIVGCLLTKITIYDANDPLAEHHAYDTGAFLRAIAGFCGVVVATLAAPTHPTQVQAEHTDDHLLPHPPHPHIIAKGEEGSAKR